jgi:hypothetical protein
VRSRTIAVHGLDDCKHSGVTKGVLFYASEV